MTYRVFKNGNRKQFVETESLSFAKKLYKEEVRRGNKMEIRENRNNRWFKVEV